MKAREYIHLCYCQMALAPRMSKMLSSPVIGIGHFYYCWIRNNKTNIPHFCIFGVLWISQLVGMATNSNIMVPQNYTTKHSNLVHGWNTIHPTTISKKFIIILIYHYLHAVSVSLPFFHA